MLSKDDPTMCKWGAVCSANTLKKEAWVGKFVQEECVGPSSSLSVGPLYLWALLPPYLPVHLPPYLLVYRPTSVWTILLLSVFVSASAPSCLCICLPPAQIGAGSSCRVPLVLVAHAVCHWWW